MHNKRLLVFILVLILFLSTSNVQVFGAGDINLASGKSYVIDYESPIENAFPNLVHNDPDSKLTDTIKAQASTSDSNWLKLYRGTAISVTIDLESIVAVNRVNFCQLQVNGVGILTSRYVNIYLSTDGSQYSKIATFTDSETITETTSKKVNFNISFDDYYKARYVRVEFSSDVWLYIDEIEVFGKNQPSEGINPPITSDPEYINAFPTGIDGVNNIVLLYTGEYNRGSISDIGKNTYQKMLPYFCYLDDNGAVKDKFFDGVLFLPLNPLNSSDSGSEPYSFSKKTGWEFYLENLLGKNDSINLSALDNLVGDYKEQIGYTAEYKYPVYISVPYIELSHTLIFGEFDDIQLIPNDLESRLTVVEWFVDTFLEEYDNAGFQNLDLKGFYWHHELVPYQKSNHEEELIIQYNEYVHYNGLSSIWIPYYCAPGFETWKELGFDAAVLQNGYSFIEQEENSVAGRKKPETVDDAANQAKKYGMGMEMEISSLLPNGNEEAYNRYHKYINTAYRFGLMDGGFSMYYQGGGPGYLFSAAYSNNPKVRQAYDLTYKYVSGTYESHPPFIPEKQFIIIKKGSRARGYLIVDDPDTPVRQLRRESYTLTQNVELSIDGAFVVLNAGDDFLGEDSFTIVLTDGFNLSNEATVKVIVLEDCLIIKDTDKPIENNSAIIYTKAQTKTGTDTETYEVVVNKDGFVESIGGNDGLVPKDGYIISAKGDKLEYLQTASVGDTVLYDNITGTVYIQTTELNDETKDTSTGYLLYVLILGLIIGIAILVFIGFQKKAKPKNKSKLKKESVP